MKLIIFALAMISNISFSFAMEASLALADCKECQLLLASQGNLINGKGKLNSSNAANVLGGAAAGPATNKASGVNK